MVRAIVGANWGDEGKGKITDMLAEQSDIIVRFQGGSNAGHTIINDYGKFALHLLPSGVFYNHTTSVIGNGVALNIPYLSMKLNHLRTEAYQHLRFLYQTEHRYSCHIMLILIHTKKNVSAVRHLVPLSPVLHHLLRQVC